MNDNSVPVCFVVALVFPLQQRHLPSFLARKTWRVRSVGTMEALDDALHLTRQKLIVQDSTSSPLLLAYNGFRYSLEQFHSYRKSGEVQKFWTSYIITEKNSGAIQKFWTSCISFIQKIIWGGPEILDQVYFIHAEIFGRSRNSGPVVFHSYRKAGAVQKFWTCCISFLQKIRGGPKILDQMHFIHTENNHLGGPEILDQLYFILTEYLGRSRNCPSSMRKIFGSKNRYIAF
jgi:hypothetical protein